jgi:hypothetical protein
VSTFRPKRVSGAELTAQISSVTASLPATSTPQPVTAVPRSPKKVQINFQASEAFAELVAREAEKVGSTRRFFARLMLKAGYEVPEADVNPPDTRRRWAGKGRLTGIGP